MKRILLIILAVVAIFLVIGYFFTSLASRRNGAFLTDSDPSFGFGGGAPATMAPAAEAPAADFAYDQS